MLVFYNQEGITSTQNESAHFDGGLHVLCTLSVLRSHWVRRKQLMSTVMEQKEASGLSPKTCYVFSK